MNSSEHFKLVRFVVGCVALICIVCAAGGIFLSFRGYTEAQMLIQVSSAGVGGLLGIITLRNNGTTPPSVNAGGDVNVNPPQPTS